MSILIKYIFFAILSTIANLSIQSISFFVYKGFFEIYVALFLGTLGGLFIKYILDKKYIFYCVTVNRKEDGEKFFLYSIMGVITTLIFWAFEIGFYYIFENENAKYVGAIIGLSIAYVIKYFLDKNFVFKV